MKISCYIFKCSYWVCCPTFFHLSFQKADTMNLNNQNMKFSS
jgi:hypothetical protein